MRYHGEEALGLVETLAIVPVIEATDKMLKAADVELVALEAGGSTLCTVFVKGDVAACRSAVEAGAAAAEKIGTLTGKNVMPRPIKAISAIVNTHDIDQGEEPDEVPHGPTQALGMVETFGVLYLMEAATLCAKLPTLNWLVMKIFTMVTFPLWCVAMSAPVRLRLLPASRRLRIWATRCIAMSRLPVLIRAWRKSSSAIPRKA